MTRPFHPILIACYPVLFVVGANISEVDLREVGPALAAALAAAGVLFLVARRIISDFQRAAFLVSTALAVAFLHQTIVAWGERTLRESVAEIWPEISMALELGALAAAAVVFRRHPENAALSTRVVNAVAIVLVAFPMLEIATFVAEDVAGGAAPRVREGSDPRPSAPLRLVAPDDPPDIYHIVLDGYARSDVLRDFFLHDNTEFIAGLESRGFFVAQDSLTNYQLTDLVLPTVLNFQYQEVVTAGMRRPRNTRPPLEMFERNRVVDGLRGLGYRIVSISSGVERFRMYGADEQLHFASGGVGPDGLLSVLVDMTPIGSLIDRVRFGDVAPGGRRRDQISWAIAQLGELASQPGPKFVFAHIHSPHPPFVFGSDGVTIKMSNFRSYSQKQVRRVARAYREEVEAVNRRVMEAVDRIQRDSLRSPVIVIHGDHGLRLFWKRWPQTTCLVESFAILNAYRLPGVAQDLLYDSISPVNTFRVIFDSYFGTDLGLLPDRQYFATGRFGIYDFSDVTKRARSCTGVTPTEQGPVLLGR